MPGAKVPKKAPLSEVSPKKTTNISARNPSANKKAAIKPKNESDDNFDVAIAKFQKNTNPLFIGCTKNGDDHDRHRKKSFDKIIKVVLDSPCVTLYFKKNITTPTDGILNAPCVFVELRGDVTLQKSWHLPSFLSKSITRLEGARHLFSPCSPTAACPTSAWCWLCLISALVGATTSIILIFPSALVYA